MATSLGKEVITTAEESKILHRPHWVRHWMADNNCSWWTDHFCWNRRQHNNSFSRCTDHEQQGQSGCQEQAWSYIIWNRVQSVMTSVDNRSKLAKHSFFRCWHLRTHTTVGSATHLVDKYFPLEWQLLTRLKSNWYGHSSYCQHTEYWNNSSVFGLVGL